MDKFYKYKPKEVVLFWDGGKLIGETVVKFEINGNGYSNCLEFERFFEYDHRSKKNCVSKKGLINLHMYGWSARTDDYGSPGVVGDFLRKTGELQTISNIVEEEDRGKRDKRRKLQFELDKKNENLDDLKMKYDERNMSLVRLLHEKERLRQDFIKETKRMQKKSEEHIRGVLSAQDMLKSDLEMKKKQLDSWRRELNRCEIRTERDRIKLEDERNKNDVRSSWLQLDSLEQKKADENVLRLVEEKQNDVRNSWLQLASLELEKG
ncbi:Factor of DNA methylation like [Heracleum sosnowskyi]|uniref:Factor of DNA methylation like n=1 Tax=Heracleum sosnowskyi TaxID=360622 RepID=A0AAD8HZ32_9APIA|nr:Factor of DNA methylation like [Heracleum sosnowskyi]